MKTIVAAAAFAGALSLIGMGAASGRPGKGRTTTVPLYRAAEHGAQNVTVTVNGGYNPAAIWVKPGETVRLTFDRKDTDGCGGTILLPSLQIKRAVTPGDRATVSFTPKKAGVVPFTCGMKMYRGQVVVSESRQEAARLAAAGAKGSSGCGGGCCQ